MAIGTTFKQQCPSCEAMVPVRDPSLIGKKIECPKCKDKFIVQAPAAKKGEDEEDDPKAKPKVAVKPAVGKKTAGRADGEDEDPKKAAGKTKKRTDDDEEDGDGEVRPKKARSSKFTLGVALAAVGLVLLVVGGYFIINSMSGTGSSKGIAKSPGKGPQKVIPDDEPPPPDKKAAKAPTKDPAVKPVQVKTPLPGPTVDLSNLLPNDTEHVAHVPFKALIDAGGLWRSALFESPQRLDDDWLREKLGFSVLAIDDLILAERYGPEGWSFSVIHFQEAVDQDAVKAALSLKSAGEVNKHVHFRAATPNPFFELLGRTGVGVPHQQPALVKKDKRALHVHFHNPQTIIFADEAPMAALLKADKSFKAIAGTGSAAQATANRTDSYVTIKPALKTILDSMQAVRGKEKLLFASATDLNAARIAGAPADSRVKVSWQPRAVWDVTQLLQESNPPLRALGVSIVQRDGRTFYVRNDLHCPMDNDARYLQQEMADEVAPAVAKFIERLLSHKVAVPQKAEPMPVADPGTTLPPPRPNQPKPPDPVPTKKVDPGSRITVTQQERAVEFAIELKLEQAEITKLQTIAGLLGCGLEAAMEVAAKAPTLHELAKAVRRLPEEGVSERGVAPGNYPPGAFPRPDAKTLRVVREPMHRISWMAALLPFLGQDTLYGKINFNQSWRDPGNWAPAGTLVPYFIDPSYPPSSYYLARPDLPFEAAATHFVGIAGIGLDAADYDTADPAVITKRGVMSYDKGISLEELRKGHGLANTIVLVQVPPVGPAGVTPWIAGGGSTLRGVPEKNSVAPFVTTVIGSDGKARRGTQAVMADGSVRYIDANVSDDVFKAMATANTPLPPDFDPDGPQSLTPIVKTPKIVATPPSKKAPPPKK